MPGAAKLAKAMPSLEYKLTSGVGAATRHLPRKKSEMRVSATKTVLVIPTSNAEDNGE